MKQVELTEAETSNDAKIFCTLTGTSESYGSVAVDDTLMVTHTRGAADADDTLSVVDGNLVANSDNVYVLDGNVLRAEYPRLNDTVTAIAYMGNAAPSETVEFKYNASGLRVQKTVTQDNEKTITDYFYHGKIVVGMAVSHTEGEEVIQDESLHFYYDAQSIPAKIKFNNDFYTYIYNAQGDIVGILDSNGSIVVEYKYSAWGKLLSTTGTLAATLGKLNPFRYRGYVYDEETGLNYVTSRYYDSEIGRWINADDTAYLGADGTLLSYNLFAYCKNNPVGFSDPSGHFAFLPFLGAIIGGAIGGAVISTVSYAVGSVLSGQEITSHGLINAAVTGAVSGAVGAAIGTIAVATQTITVAAKGIASIGLGIVMGIKSGIETNGSDFERVMTGVSTGLITAGSTFLGSQIDAYDVAYGFAGNMFTNSSATLFVGIPAEMVSVASQQAISVDDNYLAGAKSSSCSSVSSRINRSSVALVY